MDDPAPEPFYPDILADFGWSEADDRTAAELLHERLPGHDTFRHVGTELKHRPVATIVGCGPALDGLAAKDLQGIVVAADGAAGRLQEMGIIPRVVVTDLDGPTEGLRWAAGNGASMVVHAHADNKGFLDQVKDLGPLACGTYQCSPDDALRPMRNLGGFTDGDRALMLCRHYGVKEVHLVAFDFDAAPSPWSGDYDAELKPKKLAWARRIVERVADEGLVRVVTH